MEPNNFMKALIWLSWTIWGTNWTFVWALLPWLVVLIPLAIYKSKVLDVLRLGDPIAIGVGVQIEKERKLLLLISVALAGVCVSVGGGITFLRLIAPHIARRLVGARHTCKTTATDCNLRFLIAVICRYFRKSHHGTGGIAGGEYRSILGAPYFIYLLVKNI
ncbi:iron chelate uptake ABC transporter family permease subunit [Peribacillus simplex]|uniref:iron chelate uptake ABC transporter family permease subunit n=1 Tax=Peribacillus simplex TaxID=1478 RepID=UPI000BA7C746|nr:iron chelate uptake ABC transporter family permease subunit [Peribacillus simplex]PAK39697.1 hypothetical protein CHI08_17145 [Peribacillus simplex]